MKFSTFLPSLAIAHTGSLLSAQVSAVPEIQYRSVPDFLHPVIVYSSQEAVADCNHVVFDGASPCCQTCIGRLRERLIGRTLDFGFVRAWKPSRIRLDYG